MPATEHAPRSRLYVLEDRQGLITIVLSCVIVIEAFRQEETKTDRAPVVGSQLAHVGYLFSQQSFGLGELPLRCSELASAAKLCSVS